MWTMRPGDSGYAKSKKSAGAAIIVTFEGSVRGVPDDAREAVATASCTDAWRSATKVVFETVEGESYESLSLDGIDLDDYIRRFQVLGGAKYRSETVGRYKAPLRVPIEARYRAARETPRRCRWRSSTASTRRAELTAV